MEIFIHGTKGGYKILYTTSDIISVSDMRPTTARESAVGQEAYAIAFVDGGCVFTKYRIIRDMPRSMATGNIAVSLFIPSGQKLAGEDVRTLLDGLLNTYCTNYAPDNNLDNVHEDWRFVESYLSDYEKKIKPIDPENYRAGTGEVAFIYYTSENLSRYLDDPYWDEYRNYKQIYLVDKDLVDVNLEKKPENPLNALRHNPLNNITKVIEFDNVKYKLFIEKQNGVNIDVYVNGNKLYNGNSVRKKDRIEIQYNKTYHEPFTVSGTWDKIKVSNPNCISVAEDNKKVTIKPIELTPKTKTITFLVTPANCKITYKKGYQPGEKHVNNKEITFSGDEIGERWHIMIVADGYKSEKFDITPEQLNEAKDIRLVRQKIIKFNVVDGKNVINNFTLQFIRTGFGKSNNSIIEGDKIIFIGDDIDQTWNIQIIPNDTTNYYPDSQQICPNSTQSPVYIPLKKRERRNNPQQQCYVNFVNGKHGKIYRNNNFVTGPFDCFVEDHVKKILNQGSIQIIPNWGYKFVKFKYTNSQDPYTYIAEAQYKLKKSYVISVILGVVILVVIAALLLIGKGKNNNETKKYSHDHIVQYVEGNELRLDSLEIFKDFVESTGGNSRFSWIPFYRNSNKDKTKNKDLLSKIDAAIFIRKNINKFNITELKQKTYSTTNQEKFKALITSIHDTLYDEVMSIMKAFPDKIDTLDLNFISKRIDVICEVIKIRDKMKNEGKKETLEKEKNTLEQRLKNLEDSIIIDKVGVIGIIEKRLLPLTGRKPSGAVASSDSGASNGTGTSGEDDDLIKEVESYIQGVDFMHEDLEKLMDRCNSAKIKKEHKTYKRLEYCIAFRTLINTFSDKMPEFNKLYQQIPKLKTDGKYKWYNFLYQITLSEDNFNSYLKIQHKYKKSLKEIEDEYNSLNKTK